MPRSAQLGGEQEVYHFADQIYSVIIQTVTSESSIRPGLSSKTFDKHTVFLSYEISICKTEMEHPRVAFSNASFAKVELKHKKMQASKSWVTRWLALGIKGV